MKCIKCQHDMAKFVYNNIIIDQCPYCGGIWLDKNEFYSLVQKLNKKYKNEDFECFHKSVPSRNQKEKMSTEEYLESFFNTNSNDSKDVCPRCSGKLKQVIFYDILIEYCDDCDGMFFDKLEFENIYLKILNRDQSFWKKIIRKLKCLFHK